MSKLGLTLCLAVGAGALSSGCSPEQDSGDIVQIRDAIINGDLVAAAANPGTVPVFHQNVRACSGTLLRPNWVLTAGHCTYSSALGMDLTANQMAVGRPNNVQIPQILNPLLVVPWSAVQAAELIRPVPGEDVALIRLSAPMARTSPASSHPSLQAMALWDGDTDQFIGPVQALGFGQSSSDPSTNYGAGTLRSAVLAVPAVNERLFALATSSSGQNTDVGDSGGSSYAPSAHYGPGPWLAGMHLSMGTDLSVAAMRHQIRHSMACGATGLGACKANIELVGGSGWYKFPELVSLGDGTFSVGQRNLANQLPHWFFSPAALSSTKRIGGDFNGDRNLDFALILAPPVTGILRLAVSQSAPFKYELIDADMSSFPYADQGGSLFPGWAQVSQPLVGDFNGDGRDDIALLAGPGWTSVPVAWSVGTGSPPSFHVTNAFVPDFPAKSRESGVKMTVGDFNGDGRDDIALVGGPGWGSIPIAFSGGDGTFSVNYISAGSSYPGWAEDPIVKAVGGDFNGDGRDDIALVGGSGWWTIPVAFSAGDGYSTWVSNLSVPDFPSWAQSAGARPVAADFNGDGRDDIALVGGSGWSTVPVAFSQGDGLFRVSNSDAGDFASLAQGGNVRPFALRGRGPGRSVHPAVEISVARDGNGLVDVFYTSTSGEIFHNHQVAQNGGWSGEISMDWVAKRIVATANVDGRLELLVVGIDDALWHNYQDWTGGTWHGWARIGGVIRKELAVVTDSVGRINVFAFGTDEGLYQIRQTDGGSTTWGGWTYIGGPGNRVAAAMNGDGRLEAFFIGLDGAVNHAWQQWADGPWSGAFGLGPTSAREIAAARGVDGSLMAFYIKGPNSELRSIWQSPQGWWGNDTSHMSSSVRQMVAFQNNDGRLNVVANDFSNRMYTAYQPSSSSTFSSFAHLAAPSGLATNSYSGRAVAAVAATGSLPMEVIYSNATDSLTHNLAASGQWAATSRLLGDLAYLPAAAPACASASQGQTLTLQCPYGYQIVSIAGAPGPGNFASYGTPGGQCGSYTVGSCDSSNSVSVVNAACQGRQSCTIAVNDTVFGPTCPGTNKWLNVNVYCK